MGEDADDFWEAVGLEDVEEFEGFLSMCENNALGRWKCNAPSRIQTNHPP